MATLDVRRDLAMSMWNTKNKGKMMGAVKMMESVREFFKKTRNKEGELQAENTLAKWGWESKGHISPRYRSRGTTDSGIAF